MDISGVGSFLKTARKNKHLTQSYVADRLGVSAQAVSKWERGENLPDIAFFPDIAEIYNVEVNEILAAGQVSIKRTSFEEDLKKVQKRLDDVIENLFDIDGYEDILEDILPYANSGQRLKILQQVLEIRDYEILEIIVPYMTNNMKTEMLHWFLDEEEYEEIENIIPIFTRKQKDIIVSHFKQYLPDPEIVDNFVPFFDKKQREELCVNEEGWFLSGRIEKNEEVRL